MKLNKNYLEEIINLMQAKGVKEIAYKGLFQSLAIKMEDKQAVVENGSNIIQVKTIEKQAVAQEVKVEEEEKKEEEKRVKQKKEERKYHEVLSPIVGTFYRAPAPDADPFVEKGDKVKVGDTLCIVEAMKNMNEIESDINGIIKDICVQNSEMVEYNQILFKIEPEGK